MGFKEILAIFWEKGGIERKNPTISIDLHKELIDHLDNTYQSAVQNQHSL
ncbi:hypothetical protein [Candidatus Paracaedibacter symbiosus]|nr:hypothetical protein [Candidatus Paracaedibacter symbiosus]